MVIDLNQLDARNVYLTMIQCIVPRPIAWVLSDNGDGSFNLAPFSYFNGVTGKPPILSISIGKKRDRNKKDTWRNIEERSRFVVHIPGVKHGSLVSATSASLEFGQSEVRANDIDLLDEPGFSLPRIRDIGVAFDCEKERIVEVGDGPQGLVLGQIHKVFIDESVLASSEEGSSDKLQVDPSKLNPLARLGGDDYGTLGNVFTIPRPR